MSVSMKINTEAVLKDLRAGAKKIVAAVEKGMLAGGLDWVGQETRREMSGRPGLKRPTGRLAGSFQVHRSGSGDSYRVRVGTNVPYARIHQEGGTIRPKNASWLTIPLTSEAKIRSPREFGGTFFYTSRNGNLLMARGTGDNLENLYVLKKSVDIPKRLHFIENWRKDAWRLMHRRVMQNLGAEFK